MGGDDDDLMSLCQDEACWWKQLEAPKDRRALLIKSRKFMRVLRELGTKLVDVNPTMRQRELQAALERVNDRIPPCLYLPLFQHRYHLFYVLSVLPSEARVFNTNKRAPFLCVAEIDVVAWADDAPSSRLAPPPHAGPPIMPWHALAYLSSPCVMVCLCHGVSSTFVTRCLLKRS